MTHRMIYPMTHRPGTFTALAFVFLALCTIFTTGATAQPTAQPTMHDDGAGFESAVDPAEDFFASPSIAREWSRALDNPALDKTGTPHMKLNSTV